MVKTPEIIVQDGQFYIKTRAGNMQTALELKKSFENQRYFDFELDPEEGYILCNKCCEKIIWGENMVNYTTQFFHEKCFEKYCKEYFSS